MEELNNMERQIGQYSNIRFPILIIRFPISIIRFPILTIRFLFPIIRLSILIIRFLLSIIRLSILIFRFLFFTYICMVCCGIFSESQVLLPTDQGLCTYACYGYLGWFVHIYYYRVRLYGLCCPGCGFRARKTMNK